MIPFVVVAKAVEQENKVAAVGIFWLQVVWLIKKLEINFFKDFWIRILFSAIAFSSIAQQKLEN